MTNTHYLSAQEAADELGVSLSTIYAYVSRGLLRSEPMGDDGRRRRYLRADVRRLRERKALRREPERAAEGALDWGTPLVPSSITLIARGHLFYRGQDAVVLSTTHTVEQVAALIWTGDAEAAIQGLTGPAPNLDARLAALPGAVVRDEALPPIRRLQALLPLLAHGDPAAYDLRPEAVPATGARLLRAMAALAVGATRVDAAVADTVRRGWLPGAPDATPLLGAALVLCADHELNVSSFTGRCVASAGATPYEVVSAGLAALQGAKHGGLTRRVAAFLREAEAAGDARRTVTARLARGEGIPGFGHPLYPLGDPRARALLDAVAAHAPASPARQQAQAVADTVAALTGQRPALDWGLVVLAQTLGLPNDAPLTLFALGRTIGWIGHAIEQYALDQLIRPRARYVGKRPAST